MKTRIYVESIGPTIDWLHELGYYTAWFSHGETYQGLDRLWRLQRDRLYTIDNKKKERWLVEILDDKLATLFLLKWS